MADETVRRYEEASELPADDAYQGAVAQAVAAGTAAERTDALRDAGLISEGELELHLDRDLNPGDKAFNFSQGGDHRLEGTVTGTPNEKVIIYDVKGNPVIMTRQQAEMRLKKRYDQNDQFYPGMPVFYRRAPVTRPEPTFECPSRHNKHRRCFWTERQAQEHFEMRHETEFRRMKERESIERENRAIEAQESQVKLMQELLEKGAVQPGQEPVTVPPQLHPEAPTMPATTGEPRRGPSRSKKDSEE